MADKTKRAESMVRIEVEQDFWLNVRVLAGGIDRRPAIVIKQGRESIVVSPQAGQALADAISLVLRHTK